MRIVLVAAAAALAGCSYSLDRDIVNARTEIVDLQRKIPAESPLWIFEGPDRFDSFLTDYDLGVPEFLYHHLLRRLDAMAEAEIDGMVQGEFSVEDCTKDPHLFRGKMWRIHGMIGDLHTEDITDAKHPVKRAHAGVFFDAAARPFLFHVTQKPDVLTLREDMVEIRGIFVKWIEYKTRSGRLVTAPFFIGKTLRRCL